MRADTAFNRSAFTSKTLISFADHRVRRGIGLKGTGKAAIIEASSYEDASLVMDF
jgi:hypothetical protein